MIRYTNTTTAFVFAFITVVGGWALHGYYSTKERGQRVQNFISEAIPEIADSWSLESFNVYMSYDVSDDVPWREKLEAYSRLGRPVKCPQSEENTMELSFIRTDEAFVSVYCEFERAPAYVRADVSLTQDEVRFSSIELVSDIFLK